jgi:hypothetical protein
LREMGSALESLAPGVVTPIVLQPREQKLKMSIMRLEQESALFQNLIHYLAEREVSLSLCRHVVASIYAGGN